VVLLTGRVRPLERDGLVERWTPYLRASGPEEPECPIVVVATQCLEVGADFSFDALVTECASLDALRQRFGRLARLGSDRPAPAVILMRRTDIEATEPDPVYGDALPKAWNWLSDQASNDAEGRFVVDLGVEALDARVGTVEDLQTLLAPSPEAPVLLPAHLDLLCQTAPLPHPEPDVSLYLHGRPGPPEVSVVWRCDLLPENLPEHPGAWVETVALCPPASGELLQAPLWRVRAWLAQRTVDEDGADVEGGDAGRHQQQHSVRPFLLWRGRGRGRSEVARSAREIRPGDVVVVPASYGIQELGQATRAQAVGEDGLDLWEAARAATGHAPAVRVNHAVLRAWLDCPPVKELLAAATDPVLDPNAIREAIDALLDYQPEDEGSPPQPPQWWLELLRGTRTARPLEHPGGGVVLIAGARTRRQVEPDLFADDDDLTSAADQDVSLDGHSRLVHRAAERIAERCLPENLSDAISLAGHWHDAGKLDPRFQLMLHQGDEVLAAAAEVPIAKSARVPASPARRHAIREASGLPESFRHEMLSLELVQRFVELPPDALLADLVLHLVASHHGHGRPFAPVAPDPSPPSIRGTLGGIDLSLDGALRSSSPPAHRLDSGVAERFWRMTRRYGWWGLPYLEAVLRLADWYASNFVLAQEDEA
jgi:CRISPR-associated endonuclease/helicase Cas3